MLVEFSVDPAAIVEKPKDRLRANESFRTLVKLWKQFGVLIVGIIGTDLLKRYGCRVDFGNKLLKFN